MPPNIRAFDWRVVSITFALVVVALGGVPASGWAASSGKPSDGWTLHIDAKKHFPGDSNLIAHHYCKAVAGGFWECQLYDGDAPDARLVGVEVVITANTYNKFSADERALWHYHKTEIPKVEATLPDLSPEEAAKVVQSLEETYGKIYLLWDPAKGDLPVGNPSVHVLDLNPTSQGTDISSVWWVALIAVVVLVAGAWLVVGRKRLAAK